MEWNILLRLKFSDSGSAGTLNKASNIMSFASSMGELFYLVPCISNMVLISPCRMDNLVWMAGKSVAGAGLLARATQKCHDICEPPESSAHPAWPPTSLCGSLPHQ